jgi:hypothetical protein
MPSSSEDNMWVFPLDAFATVDTVFVVAGIAWVVLLGTFKTVDAVSAVCGVTDGLVPPI